jgi:hypothetical protein
MKCITVQRHHFTSGFSIANCHGAYFLLLKLSSRVLTLIYSVYKLISVIRPWNLTPLLDHLFKLASFGICSQFPICVANHSTENSRTN